MFSGLLLVMFQVSSFDALAAFDDMSQASMALAYNLPLPDFIVPGYARRSKIFKSLAPGHRTLLKMYVSEYLLKLCIRT